MDMRIETPREALAKRVNEAIPSHDLKDRVLSAPQLRAYWSISEFQFGTVREISKQLGLSFGTVHNWISIYAKAGLLVASSDLVNNTSKRAMTYRRRYSKVEFSCYDVKWLSNRSW